MKRINKIIDYIQYNFGWLDVYNTPFKGIKPKFYFGEIYVGTPYFLPRKWRKYTKKELKEEYENPKTVTDKPITWEKFSETKKDKLHAVSIKWFGINYVTLGWKTKFDEFRFEWNPMLSIVLFNRQFVIWFKPNIECKAEHAYWEAYLYYKYETSKELPRMERFRQCVSEFSTTWVRYKDGKEEKEDYYNCILKKKYAKIYKEWKT